MNDKQFNLVTDPWIKVIETKSEQEKTVSLLEFFDNAQNYRQLAGEMRSQDLVVLRLLLAILTTVYTRVDAQDNLYEWLEKHGQVSGEFEIDQDEFEEDGPEALLATWRDLYQAGHFTKAVTQYLQQYQDRFDFFGVHPFYQVTTAEYDAQVPKNKQIAAGKGQVAIKQINRRISESGNKPAIFAPKAGVAKNQVSIDELVRWLIMYQNFTGVTDKSKIETTEKFSNPSGWVYRLNPVFVKGETLFETLMLNLVLFNSKDDDEYFWQKPVWEYQTVRDYISDRKKQLLPDNVSALYTAWSRLLHIEWDSDNQPIIYSAGIPMYETSNAFVEPMTTWRRDKKTNDYRPALKGLRSLGIAMWRNFGQYVRTTDAGKVDDIHEPELVVWLRRLKSQQLIARDKPIILNLVALLNDGNASSQMPAFELVDDMQLQADVLFDPKIAEHWPTRIEDTIELTQTIGTDYYHFASDIARIRNLDARSFASKLSTKFYERLNEPFKAWLSGLTGHDDRDKKIDEWKMELKSLTNEAVTDVLRSSSPRDVKGILTDKGQLLNVFTAKNHLIYNLNLHLELKKGDGHK